MRFGVAVPQAGRFVSPDVQRRLAREIEGMGFDSLWVGAGWLEKEFDALSASFAERGAVTDEYLRVIRDLWETDTSTFAGRWKRYEDMRMFPKGDRSRTTTIPIMVGGNSPASIRRAGELGDGWHPINLSLAAPTPDDLLAILEAFMTDVVPLVR